MSRFWLLFLSENYAPKVVTLRYWREAANIAYCQGQQGQFFNYRTYARENGYIVSVQDKGS